MLNRVKIIDCIPYIAIIIGAAVGLIFLSDVIVMLLFSVMISYTLKPVSCFINVNILRTNQYSIFGIAIVLLVFFGMLIFGIAIFLPALYSQTISFGASLPKYHEYMSTKIFPHIVKKLNISNQLILEQIDMMTHKFNEKIVILVSGWVRGLWQYMLQTVNTLVIVFLMPVITFYLMYDWGNISAYCDRFKKSDRLIDSTLMSIITSLGLYVKSQIKICVLMAMYYCTLFALIDVDLSLLIGVVSGLLIVIPVVGFVSSLSIAIFVSASTFNIHNDLIYILSIYLLGHVLESYVLTPKILGKHLGLHPLFIIISLIVCGKLFGIFGLFLSVPTCAILKIIIHDLKIYKAEIIMRKGIIGK